MQRRRYLVWATAALGVLPGCIDVPTEVEAVVGEPIEGEQLLLVVEGFERGYDLHTFTGIEPDGEFAVVQLGFENTGDDPRRLGSVSFGTTLQDDDGDEYTPVFTHDHPIEQFDDSQLLPGEVGRGLIAFDVPVDATGLSLVDGGAHFPLYPAVSRLEVDLETATDVHELEQDLRVDPFDVGGTATVDGFAVSVHDVQFEPHFDPDVEPSDGNEFAVVDVEMTNDTGVEHEFRSNSWLVKDAGGWTHRYDRRVTRSREHPFERDEPFTDGESRRGELVYQSEAGGRPLFWTIKTHLFTDGDKQIWQVR